MMFFPPLSSHASSARGVPRRTCDVTVLLVLLVSVVGLGGITGCEPEKQAANNPPPPPPSPETRYERFLDEFRRRLGGDGAAPPRYTEAGTSYRGDYQIVEDTLTPPTTKSGLYRAKIVIRVRSTFTVFNTEEPEESEEEPEKPELFVDPDSAEEIEIPGITEKPNGVSRSQFSSAIQTRDDEDLIECKLVFVEGRWVLKTPLDRDTNYFLSEAMRLALDRQ